jgi:hypothetical protein
MTPDYWRHRPSAASLGEGEREVRLSIIRVIRDHLRRPTDDPLTWHGYDFDFTGALFDGGDFGSAKVLRRRSPSRSSERLGGCPTPTTRQAPGGGPPLSSCTEIETSSFASGIQFLGLSRYVAQVNCSTSCCTWVRIWWKPDVQRGRFCRDRPPVQGAADHAPAVPGERDLTRSARRTRDCTAPASGLRVRAPSGGTWHCDVSPTALHASYE